MKGALNQDPSDQAPGQSQTDDLTCPRLPLPRAPGQGTVLAPGGSLFTVSSGLGAGSHTRGPGVLSLTIATAGVWAQPPNPEAGAPGRLCNGSVLQGLAAPSSSTRETLGWPGLSSGQALRPGASHPAPTQHRALRIIQTAGGGLESGLGYPRPTRTPPAPEYQRA